MAGVGKEVADAAKDKAKQIVKNNAKSIGKKIAGFLLKNPYFWMVAGVMFIIIIVVGTFIDIDEQAEDPTDGMYSTSDDQWEQLIRFIGCMEGGTTKYKNDKGEDCYKVLSDGSNGYAVVGLDTRYYSSYFESLGYSMAPGALIPVDVVVPKKEETIKRDFYDPIESRCSGLNLTQYQLFALTSRAFNCGVGGTFSYNAGEEVTSAYRKYWNQSRDDKYNKSKEADLSHKLYTNSLSAPVTSNGMYMAGLERRRKEEFRLFQCGWYHWDGMMDEKFIDASSSGGDSGNILQTAEKIHKYMEEHKYNYYGTYASTFEGSKQYKACVCASFVSWVLIDCGYINTCYHDCGNLDNLLAANTKFERINKVKNANELKAGDILIYEDYWSGGYGRVHTEIYAGNNTIYNAGSTNALQRENPYYKDMQAELNRRPVTRVYRLKQSANTNKSGSQYVGISQGGYNSIYTSSITGKKFKEFKQNASGYNYPNIPSGCSWSSECGTVSTLIVGSGYNNKLTLKDAADRLYATGGATSINGYTAYFTGRNVESSNGSSVSYMTDRLKKGYVGVIHNPGYSSRGHYLAVLDISKDCKQVYISNPDVYGSAGGGNNGATKEGWNNISTVCNAIDYVAWVKK